METEVRGEKPGRAAAGREEGGTRAPFAEGRPRPGVHIQLTSVGRLFDHGAWRVIRQPTSRFAQKSRKKRDDLHAFTKPLGKEEMHLAHEASLRSSLKTEVRRCRRTLPALCPCSASWQTGRILRVPPESLVVPAHPRASPHGLRAATRPYAGRPPAGMASAGRLSARGLQLPPVREEPTGCAAQPRATQRYARQTGHAPAKAPLAPGLPELGHPCRAARPGFCGLRFAADCRAPLRLHRHPQRPDWSLYLGVPQQQRPQPAAPTLLLCVSGGRRRLRRRLPLAAAGQAVAFETPQRLLHHRHHHHRRRRRRHYFSRFHHRHLWCMLRGRSPRLSATACHFWPA